MKNPSVLYMPCKKILETVAVPPSHCGYPLNLIKPAYHVHKQSTNQPEKVKWWKQNKQLTHHFYIIITNHLWPRLKSKWTWNNTYVVLVVMWFESNPWHLNPFILSLSNNTYSIKVETGQLKIISDQNQRNHKIMDPFHSSQHSSVFIKHL